MRAEAWQAVAQLLVIAGAISTGVWAVYTYRKAQRAQASRWVQDLHSEFYTDPVLLRGRELLEYDYPGRLARLLQLRVTDRDVALNAIQRRTLQDVDRVLNFLEQLVYMEDQGHFNAGDSAVFFEYWFGVLEDPGKPELHRYLAVCGYEHLSRRLRIDPDDYVVFYGTLAAGPASTTHPQFGGALQLVGPCTIPGHQLVDLGEWPGLVPGPGEVAGQLWRVLDRTVFRRVDRVERYEATAESTSGYLRRLVSVSGPAWRTRSAWAYLTTWVPTSHPAVIESGNWMAYTSTPGRVQLRNATPSDAETLARFAASLDGLTRHSTYSYWVLCTFAARTCFLAEQEGNLVGFATAVLSDTTPRELFLWQVGVAPDWRGKGIAARLLDRVAEAGRMVGAETMQATIIPGAGTHPVVALAHRLAADVETVDHAAPPVEPGSDGPAETRVRFALGPPIRP